MNTLVEETKNFWYRWLGISPIIRFAVINISIFLSAFVWKNVLIWNGSRHIYSIVIDFFIISHPSDLFTHRFWTIFTYFFVHDSFFQLVFDMLFMHLFGKIVINYMHRNHFIHLYLWGGIISGLFSVIIFSIVPYYKEREALIHIMGSSPSLFALACTLLVFIPNYYISLWIIGHVKIKWVVIFYMVMSFAESIETNSMNTVCYIMGGLFGCVYGLQIKKNPAYYVNSSFWERIKKRIRLNSPFKKVNKNKQKKTDMFHKETDSLVSQEEIDIILDKISLRGYDSLTKEEKEKLFSSSHM